MPKHCPCYVLSQNHLKAGVFSLHHWELNTLAYMKPTGLTTDSAQCGLSVLQWSPNVNIQVQYAYVCRQLFHFSVVNSNLIKCHVHISLAHPIQAHLRVFVVQRTTLCLSLEGQITTSCECGFAYPH